MNRSAQTSRILGTAVLAAVVAFWGAPGASTRAAEAASRAGQVVVVSAENSLQPKEAGEHTSTFSLRLPEGATCPGDSRNDDWRIQTFFVPTTDDPGSLTYYVTGPAGPEDDRRVSLYTLDGRPFVDELLAANARPGMPGEIPAFPAMSFKRLPVDYLPSGSYLLGVACTDRDGRTQKYWDTQVDVFQAPGAMNWRVTAQQPESLGEASRRWLVPVLIAAGAVLLAAAVLLWRSARTGQHHDEEAVGEG